MSVTLIIAIVGCGMGVLSGITALVKFIRERKKEDLAENAANVKAPAESFAAMVASSTEGAGKVMALMQAAAEEARKEADRKEKENEKLLSRITHLEEQVRLKEAKIEELQNKVRELRDDVANLQSRLRDIDDEIDVLKTHDPQQPEYDTIQSND